MHALKLAYIQFHTMLEMSCIIGMLGYVELLEHLHVMMYLYYVLRILQLTTVALLLVRFWRKW